VRYVVDNLIFRCPVLEPSCQIRAASTRRVLAVARGAILFEELSTLSDAIWRCMLARKGQGESHESGYGENEQARHCPLL
jgi:hypothetical protein